MGPWEQLKNILSQFGIILSSPYELEFVDDEYRIESVSGYFGANGGKVLYKNKIIAKGSVDGSNYCDSEGKSFATFSFCIYTNKNLETISSL